jgi:hypothetical protein
MNCKPGDLAFIVHSEAGNEGRIVEVVRWVGFLNALAESGANDWWQVRPLDGKPILWTRQSYGDFYVDRFLRPIRPGSITEEEVKELFSPNTTKETA